MIRPPAVSNNSLFIFWLVAGLIVVMLTFRNASLGEETFMVFSAYCFCQMMIFLRNSVLDELEASKKPR